MQILLIVQVGSCNWGCTERRKHFSIQKLYILSFYLHSQNFFDNFFLLSLLTSYGKKSFIRFFWELFSPLVLLCLFSWIWRLLCLLFKRSFKWAFSLYCLLLSILLVRESSPFRRNVLNWFNEGYYFYSPRTLIILHSLASNQQDMHIILLFAFSLHKTEFPIFSFTI